MRKKAQGSEAKPRPGRDGLGRLLLVCLLAAWMFLLGVLVGRGTAPVHFDIDRLQKELAGLKDAMLKDEEERLAAAPGGAKEETELDFFEALKAPEDQMQDTGEEIQLAAPQAPEAPAAEPEAPAATQEAQETAVAEKEPAPDSTAPAAALTIQVAALRKAQEAQATVKRLREQGYEAYMSEGLIPGSGIWYRVRVGSYTSRAEALETVGRLRAEWKGAFVVNR